MDRDKLEKEDEKDVINDQTKNHTSISSTQSTFSIEMKKSEASTSTGADGKSVKVDSKAKKVSLDKEEVKKMDKKHLSKAQKKKDPDGEDNDGNVTGVTLSKEPHSSQVWVRKAQKAQAGQIGRRDWSTSQLVATTTGWASATRLNREYPAFDSDYPVPERIEHVGMAVSSESFWMPTGRTHPYVLNEKQALRSRQYIAAVIAALGAFCLGNCLGWSVPALSSLQSGSFLSGLKPSSSDILWTGGLLSLGAAVFAFPAGYLMDVFGRKYTMLLLLIPTSLGWGLIVFATTVEMLFVGRLLTGMCSGSFTILVPIYTGEIAEASIRGILGGIFYVSLSLGILLAFVVGGTMDVFAFTMISGVAPLVFFFFVLWIPESPVFLLFKRREERALRCLKFLRGPDWDVNEELLMMKNMMETSAAAHPGCRGGYAPRYARRGFLIAFGLTLLQVLSGMHIVLYYIAFILEDVGHFISAPVAAILLAVFLSAFSLSSLFLVDRYGRRPLLLISISLMATSHFFFGVYLRVHEHGHDPYSLRWMPILCLSVFISAFGIGVGPLSFTLLGELFPPHLKGLSASSIMFINWSLIFISIMTFIFLPAVVSLSVIFLFFSCSLWLSFFFIYFAVNETQGKTLEDVLIELGEIRPGRCCA